MAVDHNNPQSRNEEILIATIDGNEYNKAPQSRMEELLLELKETIEEGGGGGGTSDYESLSNQPQVNGETLIGDKTGAELGLVDAVEGKGLSTNDYDDNEKAAVAAATSAISAMKDGTDLDSFGDVEVALLDKADTADLGTAASKNSTNVVTSGSTDLVESGAVKDAIDAAVSAAYHHAGTKTVAQLTHDLLIASNEGNVYNITDSGTTTSDFIEGIGKTIDEGSNVGICKVGNAYMFDLLSGFVDTTNFVQKSQTSGLLKNDGTVNDEIEDDVDSLKSGLTDLTDHVDGDAVTYPYADVITIEDAVPSNLADCSVKVEPVQDLHGYDKPWVGGAGKNKLPLVLADLKTANATGTWADNVYTINGGTITVNTDDGGNVLSIVANGTFSPSIRFNLSYPLIGGFLNGCHTGGGWSKYVILQDGIGGDEGNGFSGAVNNVIVQIYINSGIQCDNLTFRPMVVDIAETDKSFAPYTNICPISGHTEASVQRNGKNMFPSDIAMYNGYYDDEGTIVASDRTGHSNLFMCKSNTSYICTISATNPQVIGVNGKWGIYFWDANKNFISRSVRAWESTQLNVTTPQNCKYMSLQLPINESATEVGLNIALSQLEEGTTPTDFVPYQGKTYTIQFGDTIYGGVENFNTGVLENYGSLEDLKTLEYSGTSGGGLLYHDFMDANLTAEVLSNMLEEKDGTASWASTTPCYTIGDDRIRVYGSQALFTTGDYADATLYYEKATPTTVQLTPQQIQLLQDTNTLYASTGQISVTANGVSGAIGQVQEQVNELRTDLSKGYLVKTFNVEGHANDTSIDFSALKPSDYNGFVNAYSCNGSGVVIQKCKNDVIYFVEALGIDATITIVYTVSQ